VGLIGAGVAVYYNSFAGVFLLDDHWRILDNLQIRQLWPPWHALAHNSRPLVQVSLAVNYALGGLNVWGYHAFNLAVHLLGGLVLFGIVRRMLQSERLRARFGGAASGLAMVVALIWLVHPLQTESVTYVIQRAESLMGLFFLLTLYCGIRGGQSAHPRAWFMAAVGACALGMGSKEVMVAAPLVMVLYDWMFIAGSLKASVRQRWGLYAGLAATWVLLGALLATSRPEQQTALVDGVTPWRYALTQFGVIVHYLRLSVWPHPLILDYGWPLAGSMVSVLPGAAVVLGLLAGTLWALYRQAWEGFWGAWFFLILAPTSSVYPIADIAFEHRMYLPLAAVVALVVIGGHEALGASLSRVRAPAPVRRWLGVGLTVAAVAVLGHATVRRNEDYRSELAMSSDTVAHRPHNPRAHLGLGAALEAQGRSNEAIGHFLEAIRLKPDYAPAHSSLGATLAMQGQIKEAIFNFEEALRLKPDDEMVHRNLGLALLKQGDTAGAIRHFSNAVRLRPDYAQARNSLGGALARQGRTKEAMAQYSEAIRLIPTFPEAHHNLGLALAAHGDIQGARTHLFEAVRLKPDYALAHNSLGALLYRQGQIEEAIAHFAEAVRLEPHFIDARNNLRIAQGSLQRARDKP